MTKEYIIQKGEKKFPPDIIEEIREDGSIVQTDVNATIRHAYIQGLIDNNCQLPSDIDEAAEKYSENILANNEDLQDAIEDAFKAGAEWYDNQMKMPNSSELISAWRGVKSILQEKDFRGDEWRLAYNAFMFGFSKGLNTRTKKK